MRTAATEKGKKFLAGVIALVMLADVLFAALYIAAESDHDCAGEDCSVCVCIRLCARTLRQTGKGLTAQTVVLLPFVLLFFAAFLFTAFVTLKTPVSKKVRLNN